MTKRHGDIDEQRRIPERSEIAAMLEKYFVGPVADDVVSKLHDEATTVLTDPAFRAGVASSFHPGNGGRGFGCAWREDLAFDRIDPRSIDVAAWIAWSQPGYPAPKPYCPDAFAGSWIQGESPSPGRWELHRDGRFSGPASFDQPGWCVHRRGSELDKSSLWLVDKRGNVVKRLVVTRLAPNELDLDTTSGVPIRLVRA